MTSTERADRSPAAEPTDAVQLLLGVARLGESDLAGWWSSQGLNPEVRFALAGFRRTGTIVGAELALLSATRRHQQLIPRPSAVHLFSPHLPFIGWTRAYLAELKSIGTSPLVEELRTWTSIELARRTLAEWRSHVGLPGARRESVTLDDLSDPLVNAGLLGSFVDAYLATSGELTVSYVDLLP